MSNNISTVAQLLTPSGETFPLSVLVKTIRSISKDEVQKNYLIVKKGNSIGMTVEEMDQNLSQIKMYHILHQTCERTLDKKTVYDNNGLKWTKKLPN